MCAKWRWSFWTHFVRSKKIFFSQTFCIIISSNGLHPSWISLYNLAFNNSSDSESYQHQHRVITNILFQKKVISAKQRTIIIARWKHESWTLFTLKHQNQKYKHIFFKSRQKLKNNTSKWRTARTLYDTTAVFFPPLLFLFLLHAKCTWCNR